MSSMGIPGDEEDSLEFAAKEDRATLGAALIMRAFRDYVQTRHGQPDPRCIAARRGACDVTRKTQTKWSTSSRRTLVGSLVSLALALI